MLRILQLIHQTPKEGQQGLVTSQAKEAVQYSRDAVTGPPLQNDGSDDVGAAAYANNQVVSTTPAVKPARTTHWGIPIPNEWDASDPVFRRHPAECDCYRHGVLQCAIPCVWAWPPGAKPGDKAWRIKEV
jgi:hypothetical protein